jgi:hypothetical protein
MSKASEQRHKALRADARQVSANVNRRIAYVTEKTKEYDSPRARTLRDHIIDALKENERLMFAICDAFDNVDKADSAAKAAATERLLQVTQSYKKAQAHYTKVEQDYTNYAIEHGALFVVSGLD